MGNVVGRTLGEPARSIKTPASKVIRVNEVRNILTRKGDSKRGNFI